MSIWILHFVRLAVLKISFKRIAKKNVKFGDRGTYSSAVILVDHRNGSSMDTDLAAIPSTKYQIEFSLEDRWRYH